MKPKTPHLRKIKKTISFSLISLMLFSCIIIFYNQKVFPQNHDNISDTLIDFSIFQQNVGGYIDDSPEKTPDISAITNFGDPCRHEIITEPYKYNNRRFEVNGDCYLRIFDEEKLPFVMLWRDMRYSNWKVILRGKYQFAQYLEYSRVSRTLKEAGSIIEWGNQYPKIRITEDIAYMKIQTHFPIADKPYYIEIRPKFPIVAHDINGNPVNRSRQIEPDGNISDGSMTGVIDNIDQIKDIEIDMISRNEGNRIYIVLSNEKGDLIRYFMGISNPLFSIEEPANTHYETIDSNQYYQPMKWSNSDYHKEPVNYIINPLPSSPHELKYIKFHSIIIEPAMRNMGETHSFLIKDIRISYDYQYPPEKITSDIQSDRLRYWDNMQSIGKEKRAVYERYAQIIIENDLRNCYYSTDRSMDCFYSEVE